MKCPISHYVRGKNKVIVTYKTAREILNSMPFRPRVSPKPATWVEIHKWRKGLSTEGLVQEDKEHVCLWNLPIKLTLALPMFVRSTLGVHEAKRLGKRYRQWLDISVGLRMRLAKKLNSDPSLKHASHKSESAGRVFQSNLRKILRFIASWSGLRCFPTWNKPIVQVSAERQFSDQWSVRMERWKEKDGE